MKRYIEDRHLIVIVNGLIMEEMVLFIKKKNEMNVDIITFID